MWFSPFKWFWTKASAIIYFHLFLHYLALLSATIWQKYWQTIRLRLCSKVFLVSKGGVTETERKKEKKERPTDVRTSPAPAVVKVIWCNSVLVLSKNCFIHYTLSMLWLLSFFTASLLDLNQSHKTKENQNKAVHLAKGVEEQPKIKLN